MKSDSFDQFLAWLGGAPSGEPHDEELLPAELEKEKKTKCSTRPPSERKIKKNCFTRLPYEGKMKKNCSTRPLRD